MAPDWYGPGQAGVCLFSGVVLLWIYFVGEPGRDGKSGERQRDPGWWWFAAAVMVWGLVGVYLSIPFLKGAFDETLVRFLSSTVNSVCFLIGAAYLDYADFGRLRLKTWLAEGRYRLRWRVGVLSAAACVASLLFWLDRFESQRWQVKYIPDLFLSLSTLIVLGIGLAQSFREREHEFGAYLTGIAVGTQILAQLPDLLKVNWGDPQWILLLTSKTAVITLFIALAWSGADEVTRFPDPREMSLTFTGREEPRGRFEVKLNAPEKGAISKSGYLATKPHALLVRFAVIHRHDPDRYCRIGDEVLGVDFRGYQDLRQIAKEWEGVKYRDLFDRATGGLYRLKVAGANIHLAPRLLAEMERLLAEEKKKTELRAVKA